MGAAWVSVWVLAGSDGPGTIERERLRIHPNASMDSQPGMSACPTRAASQVESSQSQPKGDDYWLAAGMAQDLEEWAFRNPTADEALDSSRLATNANRELVVRTSSNSEDDVEGLRGVETQKASTPSGGANKEEPAKEAAAVVNLDTPLQRGGQGKYWPFPWRAMAVSSAAWAVVAGNTGAGMAINVVMSWLPTYYEAFIQVDLSHMNVGLLVSFVYR